MITESNRHSRARQSKLLGQIWSDAKPDPDFLHKHASTEERVMLDLAANERLDPTALEPHLRHDLEAFTLRKARPVFLVRGGAVNPSGTSALWRQRIAQHALSLHSAVGSVGRIDALLRPAHSLHSPGGDPTPQQLGTCFAIGPNLVLTTRQVAAHFCQHDLSLRIPCRPTVNFAEEPGRDPDLEFAIVGCVAWDADLDFALLETSPGSDFPRPLRLAESAAEIRRASDHTGDRTGDHTDTFPLVCSVGYPAFETRAPTDVLLAAYGSRCEAKRASFGRLANASRFSEATDDLVSNQIVLGAQPGSPLIDLASGLVIGLHYSGRYGDPCHATAMWSIQAALEGRRQSPAATSWAWGCPPVGPIPFPFPIPRPHPLVSGGHSGGHPRQTDSRPASAASAKILASFSR